MNKKMYKFWIDKQIPYCCRDCVPLKFQHKNQLYEYDMYGKVCESWENKCPKFRKKKEK